MAPQPSGERQLRTFPPGMTPHDYSTYRRPSTRHACLAISLAGTAHLILSTAYVLPISGARVPARMWDGSWDSALQQHRHEQRWHAQHEQEAEPRAVGEYPGLSATAWLPVPAEVPVGLPGWRQGSSPASRLRRITRRAGADGTESAPHPYGVMTPARQAPYWPRPAARRSGRPPRRSGPWSRAGT